MDPAMAFVDDDLKNLGLVVVFNAGVGLLLVDGDDTMGERRCCDDVVCVVLCLDRVNSDVELLLVKFAE